MGYLEISPTQAKALAAIAGIDVSAFNEISRKLREDTKPSVRASKLFEAVKEISINQEFSKAFCSQFVSLATFRRISKRSVEELVDAFVAGIRKSDAHNHAEWFEAAKDEIVELLYSDVIRVPAKALHLSTDFENLYSAAHVVTDIRPVFDGDRETVVGAVVAQTLKINFVDSRSQSGDMQISLALDVDDIEKLIKELETAKLKAISAKDGFSKNTDLDIFVVGEETYGFG